MAEEITIPVYGITLTEYQMAVGAYLATVKQANGDLLLRLHSKGEDYDTLENTRKKVNKSYKKLKSKLHE